MNKVFLRADRLSRLGAEPVSQALAALSDLVLVTTPGQLVEEVAGNVRLLERLAAPAWRGQPLHAIFVPSCHHALDQAVREASAGIHAASCRLVHSGQGDQECTVDYAVVPADPHGALLFLGRMVDTPDPQEPDYQRLFASADEGVQEALLSLIAAAPEAIVVASAAGQIVWANGAFGALAEASVASSVKGLSLDRFFDSNEMDINVALAGVRQRGPVRMLRALLRGAAGQPTAVELSITPLASGHFGIVMRDLSMRAGASAPADTPASVKADISENGIASAFGDISMHEWVRLHVDELEKGCIEAALKLTGQNRAAAARALGVSRQALYVKLSRYGLVDPD